MKKRTSKPPRREALALARVESLGIQLQEALEEVEQRRAALDALLWLVLFLCAFILTRRLLRIRAGQADD